MSQDIVDVCPKSLAPLGSFHADAAQPAEADLDGVDGGQIARGPVTRWTALGRHDDDERISIRRL
jgi:hypothetical protein